MRHSVHPPRLLGREPPAQVSRTQGESSATAPHQIAERRRISSSTSSTIAPVGHGKGGRPVLRPRPRKQLGGGARGGRALNGAVVLGSYNMPTEIRLPKVPASRSAATIRSVE